MPPSPSPSIIDTIIHLSVSQTSLFATHIDIFIPFTFLTTLYRSGILISSVSHSQRPHANLTMSGFARQENAEASDGTHEPMSAAEEEIMRNLEALQQEIEDLVDQSYSEQGVRQTSASLSTRNSDSTQVAPHDPSPPSQSNDLLDSNQDGSGECVNCPNESNLPLKKVPCGHVYCLGCLRS
jgi:hypothetical protein